MSSELQKALQVVLDALNLEVEVALAKRKAWMDAHMENFSDFKVGDEVYDGRTGQLLGVVSKLYRYHDRHSPLYDTQMAVEIEYLREGTTNCYDNSSRHAGGGPHFCTREVALSLAKNRAEHLARKARGSNWSELFK